MDFPVRHCLLHGEIGFHISIAGVVEQHHVDVTDVQGIQRQLDGGFRIIKLAGVELCNDENFFPWYIGIPHGPANGSFVVIHISRINQPAACFQKCCD